MIDIERLRSEGYVISKEYIENLSEDREPYFEAEIKRMFFNPGFAVRLDQEQVKQMRTRLALGGEPDVERDKLLASCQAAGNRSFVVERVHLVNTYSVSYKLEGVDVMFDSHFIIDARPTKHMYGLVISHQDKIFAVEFAGNNVDNMLAVNAYEIRGGVEPGFGDLFDAKTLEELKTVLETPEEHELQQQKDHYPARSGEFGIADTGDEVWALAYSSWYSGVDPKEMAAAIDLVEAAMNAAPKLN